MARIRQKRRPKFRGKKIPRRSLRKANRRRQPSGLERQVYLWLREDGIAFEREKTISQCHADLFLAPRTIVELNGCHWHGCRICNRDLTQEQEMAQVKDARRYAFFRSQGYDIVVIWECEVNREPERVRAQLQALARR